MSKHKKGFADAARRFTNHVKQTVREAGADVKMIILPQPEQNNALVVFVMAGRNFSAPVPVNPRNLLDETGVRRADEALLAAVQKNLQPAAQVS